ncbi:YhjD/YihY/BrkB family envelope integrity protein, partial [Arthrospira platensis SPKY1]|nr:YhjD/YihY/BrkB family envelope integrity protein [Arthrospira platensis SPKY1]
FEFFQRVFRLFLRKDVFFNAAAISFNVLICILPIVLILVSVLGFLLSDDETFVQFSRLLQETLPPFLFEQLDENGGQDNLLHALLDPIILNRNVNGLIGLVVLIFFFQSLFSAIGHALHDI